MLACMLSGGTALAQHLVLLPAAFDASLGGDLTIRAQTAGEEGASAAPWPVEIAWLFVRSAGMQENRGPEDAPTPVGGRVGVSPAAAGVALIGLDLPARTESTEPERVLVAARAAGRTDVCPERPVVVRWVKSAATLVRVRDATGSVPSNGTGTSKAGLLAEIRPLMDAARVPAGGVLPVRAYLLGDAAPGAVILATHAPSGQTQRVTADAKGIADIQITTPGTWVIRSTMIRESAQGEAAHTVVDLTVGETSLTFDAPAPLPEPPPEKAP